MEKVRMRNASLVRIVMKTRAAAITPMDSIAIKGYGCKINIADSILWRVVSGLYLSNLITGNTKDRISYQKKLKKYDNKIAASEKNLKDIENRITKVENRAYLDGNISIDSAKGISSN